jgi:RHS repeat-associated protein
MAIANYVLNNIHLTDALSYDRNGDLTTASINCGGVNRGALATYMEKQGNPIEQCALLIYLLRKCSPAVPCGYVFPSNNMLQMLDQRMSSILRIQLHNAVDPYGNAIMPQIIPVNYPWVVAYINGQWVHIFPWMKDTSITEGYDLNPLMPGPGVTSSTSNGYQSGLQWMQAYVNRDPAILSLSTTWDDPAHLFVPFVEKYLALEHPTISLSDVGIQAEDRQNTYATWAQFPQPWGLNGSLSANNFQASLGTTPTIFNTIEVSVQTYGNGSSSATTLFDTGAIPALYFHDRRLMVHETQNGTGSTYTMGLSLAPLRPGTTTVGTFASTGDMVNKQVLSNASLPVSDVVFTISISYNRNLNMPTGFTQPSSNWNQFLGVIDTQTVTAANIFFSGDLVTYCLDFGNVTQEMLDSHAQTYWNDQQTIAQGQSSSVDPDDLIGEPVYLMGLSWDKASDDFQAETQSLYKEILISQLRYGAAKINAQRNSDGSLPSGQITLLYPSFDLDNYEEADAAYDTANAGTSEQFTHDSSYLRLAAESANEHTIINTFWNLTDSASTIHVLDVAQEQGHPIAFLTSQNYSTQGSASYTATVNGTSTTQPLSAWAGSEWSPLVTIFQNSPYAFAYLTPGDVTCANGSFTGMGYLIADGFGDNASLLAFNQQQIPINGGTGSSLAAAYAITTSTAPNWQLSNSGLFYTLSYTPATTTNPVFATGSFGNQSFTTLYADLVAATAVLSNYDIANVAAINAMLGFTNSGSGGTLEAAQLKENGNSGSVGFAKYIGQLWQQIAEPVDVIDGSFYVNDTDLSLPGPLPIHLKRNYLSLNQTDNEFGYGWKLNYEPYLVVSANGALIWAAEADGSVIAYRQQASPNNTHWVPMPSDNPSLVNEKGNQSGSLANPFNNYIVQTTGGSAPVYVLYGVDGSTRTYATASYPTGGPNGLTRTRPYLTTWQDSSKNTLTFTIGSTSTAYDYGKLNRITSSNGNYIQFDYDQYGHIITANASDGRQLTYTYNTYGDLTSVTRADGTVVSYVYDEPSQTVNGVSQTYSDHLLLQENKPDGRQLVNTYDSSRRVTEQQATVGSDSSLRENASFTYSNTTNSDGTLTGTTTVTAYQSGSLNYATTYTYAESEITQLKDPVNPARTQTWYATSNSSGAYQKSLQQTVDSRGLTENFLYDSNGNVKEIDTIGDLTGSGSSVTQTTTATYNAQNLPTLVTDTSTGNSTAYTYGSSISPYLPTLVAYSASGNVVSQTAYTYENVQGANGVLQQVVVAQSSPDAAETDYTYTSQGYVASETHLTGTSDPSVSYSYTYDPCGRVAQKTDAAGRTTLFSYDALDHLISTEVHDQSGNLAGWHFDYYDDNGELQWTNGPRFSPDDYTYRQYDGGGRLTQFLQYHSAAMPGGAGVQQSAIATTSNQYDFFGDLMLTMDPNGNTAQMTYDGIGQMLTRQRYDSANNLLATESFTYEPGGKVASHTNAIGGVTQYSYTQRGQLKEQINPDGSTKTWAYQLDGRLIQVAYPNGSTRNIVYNDSARTATSTYKSSSGSLLATESETYDRRGNLSQKTDVAGYTTSTTCDSLNRVKSVIGPPGGNGSAQQAITYTYDSAGIVDLMTNAAGETTRTTYDALSRPVEVDVNSPLGNTVRRVAYNYSSDHQSVTSIDGTNTNPVTTTTDIQGQPVLVRKADDGFVLSQYDLNENLISSTDELGRTTVYAYDGLNRVAQQLLPDGAIAAFGYDAAGDLQSRAMPEGLTWSATYDSSSRKLSEKLVQGSGTTRTYGYTYYPSGELDTVTDPRGIVRTYSYDGFDRVQSIAAVDGSAAELGLTQTYSYDPRGLVTELDQVYQNASVSPSTSVLRAYDGYGAITAEQTYINGTYSSGGVLKDSWQQTHDNAGRRTQLTETNFAATPFSYAYQADGSLVQTAFNGQNYQYSFGPDGLLTSRSTPWVTQNIVSRDPVGRITEQRQSVGGNSILDEVPAWQADSTQESWAVTRTGSGTWNESRSYGYDLRSHLASETYFPSSLGAAVLSYQFDGNTTGGLGQRTALNLNNGSSGSSTSTYGAFARLNQVATTGLLTSSLGSPVNDTYDATGQLTTHDPGANTDTLSWDAFGRLVAVQRTGTTGFSWQAVYDGFGRRLQTSTVASGTGLTVQAQSSYDPEVQFLELATTINGQREWLVHGPDLTGGYGDLQGTGGIDAVINPSTGTATGVVSDVYGHVEATVSGTTVNWNPVLCVGYGPEPGLTANPFDGTNDVSTFLAWRSKYIDPTGFYYLGNRYYDPQSGTFLSPDPLGHAASMSLYDYCSGDPVNRLDPEGMLGTTVKNGAIAGAAYLGGGFVQDAGYVIDTVDNAFYGTGAGAFNVAARVDSAMQSGFTDFSAEHSPWNQMAQAMQADTYPTERAGWYTNNAVTAGIQNAGSVAIAMLMFAGEFDVAAESSTIAADTEGIRAMQMPNYSGNLGPGVLGSTDASGNITIANGLSWEEQAATLRHESVHAFFSVSDNAPFAAARQNFGMWAYNNSQLARFSEEAIAETYGSGSLLQGLAHPFVNGYGITAGGLLMETGAYAGAIGGAGYLGYKIGGGQ